MSRGGKNLIILGFIATFIALLTSGISLFLYHKSGDIYLDRSRPGFLPEKTEPKEETTDYEISDYGPIDTEITAEFVENYDKELEYLESFTNPFSVEDLSDEALGFPTE